MAGRSAAGMRCQALLAAACVLLSIQLASAACVDKPVPGKFTCAQQRAFGKCNVSFMKGFCNKTCGRCKAVKATKPGTEPGPNGTVRPCPVGTFKRYAGTYPCGKCPPGTIQPYRGKTSCIQCALDRTNNAQRNFCVKLPNGKKRHAPPPVRTPKPKPRPTPRPISQTQKNAQIYAPTRKCAAAGSGGTNCGIPVGYAGDPGRTGTIYIPRTCKSRKCPLLIVLHGSGVDGNWMLTSLPFTYYADVHQTIIVAPDSHYDENWSNPALASSPFTPDWYHTEACYSWAVRRSGAKVDTSRVAIAGNSRAGYMAPPFCSRSTVVPCQAAVIMHANALAQQMGKKVIPILWTTGIRDNLYGPAVTAVNRKRFHQLAPRFPITYRLWSSGHPMNKGQEIGYLIEWAVTPSFRRTPAPPLGTYRKLLAASPAEKAEMEGRMLAGFRHT